MGIENTEFRLTASREDLESTFRLLYVAYVENGIAYPNPQGLRATPYHLSPSTEVAVASYPDRIVCTGTLVRDGPMGLPMESIYSDQVESRRSEGISLAEISCLAHAERPATRNFRHVIGVMSLIAQAARSRGVEQLLLTVHPRHAKFYSHYMGCTLIGEPTQYETVCYQPAVALCLDMVGLAQKHPHGYQKLFGMPHPFEAIRQKPMSRNVLRWIGSLLEIDRQRSKDSASDSSDYILKGPWTSDSEEAARAVA